MSQSTKATVDSFAMSPHIVPSQSSGTTVDQSSILPSDQAAIDRWMLNRARTEGEHAAFREKMQFQSADFHHFLYKTAKTSPKISVASPAWENIPFPVPAQSPTISEGHAGQNLATNASIDEIRDVPRRQPTPLDFGSRFHRQSAPGLHGQVPSVTYDRASYDGAQPGNKDALITVGAIFEVGRNSMEITPAPIKFEQSINLDAFHARAYNTATSSGSLPSDTEMEIWVGDEQLEQDSKRKSCIVKPFVWVRRQFTKLF
ncbi:hypothetical protein EYC80_000621 [Monilinia laxa]|uniref:Uncharacterized protein n=1 Tax=Monilinia laxa TaxID=61186 RepID=A0A5N6KCE4_MONLA|nr:hypothetical protein EYC80_000621 [Monilinia laxa]